MDMEDQDRKVPKQLYDARLCFGSYLRHRKPESHYLSVDRPDAPLRRADNDEVTEPRQRSYIQVYFRWGDAERRWMKKNGEQIVIEDEIFNTILSYRRVYQNSSPSPPQSHLNFAKAFTFSEQSIAYSSRSVKVTCTTIYGDELYDRILKAKEGIQFEDVLQAVKLWSDHKLGLLVAWDDENWGGPAAIFDPIKPAQPSRKHLRSNSPSILASSSPGTDQQSSTPATDLSAEAPPSQHNGYQFHPEHPGYLHVGTCEFDENDVWLSMSARTGSQSHTFQSVFYDSLLNIKAEDALCIIWNKEFELSKFAVSRDEGTPYVRNQNQRRAQRRFLFNIIQRSKMASVPIPKIVSPVEVGSTRASAVHIPVKSEPKLPSGAGTDELSRLDPHITGLAQENANEETRSSFIVILPMPKRRRTTHGIESNNLSEQESDALSIPQKKRRRTTQEVVDAVRTTEQAEALRPRQNKSAIVRDAILVSSESPERVFPKRESSVITNTIHIPPNATANTSLLVSVSDRPARAPANVPLEDCLTEAQLFETLIIECNLKGKAAAELSEVSATYTWGGQRQHLIRKGRPRDWNIFCMDIKKAWERDSVKLAEDGCEIKIMVHVDS